MFVTSENRKKSFRIAYGDKSITHRAFFCGAFADGLTRVTNACLSRDTLATMDCLKKLGARFEFHGTEVEIFPVDRTSLKEEQYVFDCRNSGTTARIMAGVAAGLGINALFFGDESLQKRPMDRVIRPLSEMGLGVRKLKDGLFETFRGENKIEKKVFAVSSAQVKSALLFAALLSGTEVKLVEKIQSRNHTEIMLKYMGADITVENGEISLMKSGLSAKELYVPNDISTAAFFVADGIMGEGADLKNVGLNPTRTEYLRLLAESGARVEIFNQRTANGEVFGDLKVCHSVLKPFKCPSERSNMLLDEIPALAILAVQSDGESKFCGVEELAKKESDRIENTLDMAKNLGADAWSENGTLKICGSGRIRSGTVNARKDHRFEMAAVVAGLHSENGVDVSVDNIDVSCPDFLKILGLRGFELGLVGEKILGSKSPKIFRLFSDFFGVELEYRIYPTDKENFGTTLHCLKNSSDGFNVTMPFKNRFSTHGLDSANCIKNLCGKLICSSTDGDGVLSSLSRKGIEVKNKHLLILGAGGSATSAAKALNAHGALLSFFNRTEEKAKSLAMHFGGNLFEKNRSYDGILSFVPVVDKLVGVDESAIKRAGFVFDAYYFSDTLLLKTARQAEVKTIDGYDMLFFQAVKSFEFFTSIKVSEKERDELYGLFRRSL